MTHVKPIIHNFLHREVVVEVEEGFAVFGRLVGYQPSNGYPHRPSVLVLENLQGEKIIIRGSFVFIATMEKEGFTNVKEGLYDGKKA